MTILNNLLKGVAVGIANIIPGVSGGTMLLILGVYERVIRALGNIDVAAVKGLFKGRAGIAEAFRRVDAVFLGTLAVGALAAVYAVAKLLVYLLNEHHDPTYGFFFGLVLLSVLVPYRMIKRKGGVAVIACALGIAAVVGLTFTMSGESRLESEQKKVAIKAAKAAGEKVELPSVTTDGKQMALLFGSGAIAIAAMILPGISGSFMLLMMGVYFDILAAVAARNLPLLGVFAAGCLIGLLLFTRLLNFLLVRYHDVTMAFLLGLVVGSLWAIWPFKTFGMAGAMRVDLHNTLPQGFGANELLTLGAVVVGCAIVGAFIWLEGRRPRPSH